MRKQINYLCHKVDQLTKTKLYEDYTNSYNQLQANTEYHQVLIALKKVNKIDNKEEYFELKSKLFNCEKDFRTKEKEINMYLNHILKRYNQLIYRNNLDQKRGTDGNNG